jgi:hypothetical protein
MTGRLDPTRCTALILGIAAATTLACGGSPSSPASPTPTPPPTAAPTPTPTLAPCGEPLPPPVHEIGVKIHLRTGLYWTLDSTPLIRDRDYCRKIGYTDGRLRCPVRPEGHPERALCEEVAIGKASDTGRIGPTWYRNGGLCTGIDSGCDNDPDNQYHVRVYWQGQGEYTACAQNGVCGRVYANGPH